MGVGGVLLKGPVRDEARKSGVQGPHPPPLVTRTGQKSKLRVGAVQVPRGVWRERPAATALRVVSGRGVVAAACARQAEMAACALGKIP